MELIWLKTDECCSDIEKLEKETFPDGWSEKALKESVANPQAEVIVSLEEGRLAGYLIIYYVLDECEIARIAVSKEFRRQGIAHRLICEMKHWCKEKEITRLMLDVRESNDGAIAFYNKEGFLVDGIRKNYYDSPKENGILMSMEI